MDLIGALAEFDGWHVAPLEVLAAREWRGGDLRVLEAAVSDEQLGVAASWVVKALLERGEARLDMGRVFEVLEGAEDWEVQLHLLQSVRFAPAMAVAQVNRVRALTTAKRAMVRVWAVDAFVRIAVESGAGLEDARGMVARGLDDGPASMRARCRALEKLIGGI